MPVNEVVMGLGSWSLTLLEETPRDVLDRLQFFGHIALIPGRLNPAEYGDSLLTMARYVGVLTGRDFDLAKKIDGQGTAVWLGDAEDKGESIETPIVINNTFPNAITAILGAGTAVIAGTLYSVPGTYKGTHVWQSKRKAVNYVCETMGAEWRVTGDCKLDAGLISDLYVTTPTCVIVRERPNRHTDGADLAYRCLRGDMALATDVDDWTSRVVVLAEGEGSTVATGSANNPSTPYLDVRGQPVKRVRLISESGTTPGNANGRAQVQLNRYLTTRNALRLTTDDYDVRGAYRVGDYVWIYDPDAGLLDTNNEIMWRGERINPIKLRIAGSNWPVREGTTVAYRHQDGSWIDLTQYIDFEGGETTVDVGELLKSLSQGGLEPVGPRPIPDSTIPGTVTWDLPFLSGVYLDALGNTRARMLVAWNLPLNVDGSTVLDGDHYEIQSGTSPATDWQTTFAPWGDLQAMVLDLSPGVAYDFRIRAVDSSNNQGAWSAVETATANPDTIPPSTPAAPTVAASLIAIQITHQLGKASGGTFNLELDLDHLEVHVGAASGFTPDSTTLRGNVAANAGMMQAGIAVVGTVPESNTSLRQVKVVAVDQAGNRSSPSAAASVTALLIDDAHITDLTVSKVTAGTISANWLIGASIRTASSGQRVELNVTGLHGFDSGNNELVSLLNTGSFTLRSAPSSSRVQLDTSGLKVFSGAIEVVSLLASGSFTLRSAASGARVELDTTGLRTITSGGVTTVDLSASGSFVLRSGTSGARIVIDQSGVELYNSGGTKVVDLNSADGSALFSGTLSSSLTDQKRLVINPGGQESEIRFYEEFALGEYHYITQNVGGTHIFEIGSATQSNRKCIIRMDSSTGFEMWYADGSGTKVGGYLSAINEAKIGFVNGSQFICDAVGESKWEGRVNPSFSASAVAAGKSNVSGGGGVTFYGVTYNSTPYTAVMIRSGNNHAFNITGSNPDSFGWIWAGPSLNPATDHVNWWGRRE